MSSDTLSAATLLVFTLGPDADSRRRPVLPPRLRSLERDLRSRCLDDILEAGRSCGLDLTVATDAELALPSDVRRFEQRGACFAGRLEAAVRRAETEQPGQPLIVVGADLPGFSSHHLESCLDRLAADPEAVVVGPSPDGGVYLIGATADLAPLLRRVDWCRRHTCTRLLEVLAAEGRRVVLLQPLGDLDRPGDLDHLLAGEPTALVGRRLAAILLAALRRIRRPLAALEVPLPRFALLVPHPHRGPPS